MNNWTKEEIKNHIAECVQEEYIEMEEFKNPSALYDNLFSGGIYPPELADKITFYEACIELLTENF